MEKSVFEAIIAMCRDRIISRTRLHPNELEPRIHTFLDEVHQGLRRLRGIQNKIPFQRGTRDLINRMNQYREKYTTTDQDITQWDGDLAGIIEGFHQLAGISNLEAILLDDLNAAKPVIDPSTRQVLLNTIEKVSQYRLSATRLVNVARRYHILRRASTVVVRLHSAAFDRPFGEQISDARDVVARVATAHATRLDFEAICSNMEKSSSAVHNEFATALSGITRNSKIHAEMQLISYLESHPSLNPPRILASNKNVCYLCNAYISVHGMYTMTGAYGRLHSGWRIPATGMGDTDERFVVEIERLIVRRARRMMRMMSPPNQKEISPFDSTLFSPACTLSTMATLSEVSDDNSSSKSHGSHETVRLKEANESDLVQQQPDADEAENYALITGAEIHTLKSAVSNKQSISLPWHSVKQGKTMVLRLSEELHLHVECSANSCRRLDFKVQQVSQEEMAKTQEEGGRIYDARRHLYYLNDIMCQRGCRFVRLRDGDRLFRVELKAVADV